MSRFRKPKCEQFGVHTTFGKIVSFWNFCQDVWEGGVYLWFGSVGLAICVWPMRASEKPTLTNKSFGNKFKRESPGLEIQILDIIQSTYVYVMSQKTFFFACSIIKIWHPWGSNYIISIFLNKYSMSKKRMIRIILLRIVYNSGRILQDLSQLSPRKK